MRKKHKERGASIVESMMCIILLCMIFFGLMQVFQWTVAQMLTEYSSFYAAKAQSLGYNKEITTKATQLALTGASGEDMSSDGNKKLSLSRRAEGYMRGGQDGGGENNSMHYKYWKNIDSDKPYISTPSNEPLIYVSFDDSPGEFITPTVAFITRTENHAPNTPSTVAFITRTENHAPNTPMLGASMESEDQFHYVLEGLMGGDKAKIINKEITIYNNSIWFLEDN